MRLKNRKAAIFTILLYIQIAVIVLMMIGTMILATIVLINPNWLLENFPKDYPSRDVIEDMALWLFPYTINVTHGLTLVSLIAGIVIVAKKRLMPGQSNLQENKGFFYKISEIIEWKNKAEFTKIGRIIWSVLGIFTAIISAVFIIVSIPGLFISPLVTLYFSILLFLLILWLSAGVKNDIRKNRLILFILLFTNFAIDTIIALFYQKWAYLRMKLAYQIPILVAVFVLIFTAKRNKT